MSAVLVLGALVAALLLPLLVSLVRNPTLGSLAVRNLRRRRGEAALVIAGSLLGTAIITSSFVVGDVVGASITDVARTQLGPVDIELQVADPADRSTVATAVRDADLADIEELLPARRATVALVGGDGDDARAVPSAVLVELDPRAGGAFGGDPAATGLAEVGRLAVDEVLLNSRTAERLEAGVGDVLEVHAAGTSAELTVAAVVDEVGLAGLGGALVPSRTFDRIAAPADGSVAAPPESLLLVSLHGGVLDTAAASERTVPQLREVVADIPGVRIEDAKASLLENAEREGGMFSELFTTIGSFSVLAGILLLVNLFVMLAEERKTELGMLRALGFTRRRLTRTFALEGALYAVVATAIGVVAGIGIGWLVALAAGSIFGIADQGITFRLVIEPISLATGALTGLTIALATIWLTSLRISRLNVIRAIRDLPEPVADRVRPRTLVLASLGVLLGAGVSLVGAAEEQAMALLLGVPVAAFAATPLVRRLLPERGARLLTAAVALGWGLGAFPLFPDVLGQADLPIFVAQGVVLTAGAVSLVSSLDVLWTRAVELGSAGGRGLATRLGLAYPLARRFRTSMLLGMFSLVIFTMTFIAAMSTMFDTQADTFTAEVRGGFDLLLDSNPANPVTAEQLRARDDVAAVAGLSRTPARFVTDLDPEPRPWPITGFDEDLIAGGPPTLLDRDPTMPSDEAVYATVAADPSLTIVSDTFLQEGGPNPERVRVGDTIEVLDPTSGAPHELTVAGVSSADWTWNGALVSRELTTTLFGPQDAVTRHYVALADRVDLDAVAAELDRELLVHGGEATSFPALVDEGLRQQTAFLTLLQAFLALGLLVGIAGLGVVMVRAVRERRQEIGMLRALGFPTRTVRAAFLSEAGIIALQGTAIGAVLGLVTARQVFVSSEAFGDIDAAFTIPWVGLLTIVTLPLLASLAATAWPAARAAAIRPAVALRVAD